VARALSVTGHRPRSLRLRGRLLIAFLLVAVPPLLLLAVSVTTLFGRRFEQRAQQQLRQVATALRDEIPRLRERAEQQLAAIGQEDLTGPANEPWPAETLARRRGLDLLELVDARGRLLASSHWPAGYGLPDADGLFPGETSLRLETVAAGYGAVGRPSGGGSG
jgi:hypothetical protein